MSVHVWDREISPEGLESNPEGEIYLTFMDWLMMDYFSPTFSEL